MPILLLIASVFAAALPMMGFVVAIWWLDRYEREPLTLVFAVFMWGAVGAIFWGLVGSSILQLPVSLMAAKAGAIAGPVLIAPLAEEPAKAFVFLLLLRSHHFDGMTDGFVYGAAAGLGFGMTENFFYFATPAAAGAVGPWVTLVIMRTFFSAVMHAMATSLVGAALGWARFRGPSVMLASGIFGLIAAMIMHATWNGLITFDSVVSAGGSLAALDVLLLMVAFALVFMMFQACILIESLTIRRQLLDEARQGYISEATAKTVSSWTQRTFRRWAPAEVNQMVYTGLAMKLALRKSQSEQLAKRGRDNQLATEIQDIRAEMQRAWPEREQ